MAAGAMHGNHVIVRMNIGFHGRFPAGWPVCAIPGQAPGLQSRRLVSGQFSIIRDSSSPAKRRIRRTDTLVCPVLPTTSRKIDQSKATIFRAAAARKSKGAIVRIRIPRQKRSVRSPQACSMLRPRNPISGGRKCRMYCSGMPRRVARCKLVR